MILIFRMMEVMMVWQAVLERFEQQAPSSVMTRLALEQALPASWIDEVFQTHRQRQYPRELLFSTVVELMLLVSLGLRPSLHAAVRKFDKQLPVSLSALYQKVSHCEPRVLRALIQGSAERLQALVSCLPEQTSLPGWHLRVIDGNHLPGSEKRLAALRHLRAAALPGHTVVVYDPDSALVCDIVSCEDAYQSERVGAALLIEDAKPGQLWMADRHFCTRALLCGMHNRQAHFIVREHEKHPKLLECGSWGKTTDIDTGRVREQSIAVTDPHEPVLRWRRIEIELNTPTEDGDTHVQLWSNLPGHVDAVRIAALYRKRWRIENLFQRLESVLHSEIRSLGHPRAALLGFATAVLAYNVLALLKRVIEQAHQDTHPEWDVSTYHLAVEITCCYEALSVALPPAHLPGIKGLSPSQIMQRLLQLAARLRPRQLASSKRKPKPKLPKGYVDASIARAHVATARLINIKLATP
jgi:IS4 transposase